MKTSSLLLISLLSTVNLFAHCQVPCGIYDDTARISSMKEDAQTITKAVKQIQELAGKQEAQSINQSVRWVSNKETHAEHIIQTISSYFLTQRVKPSQADYQERLKAHHKVILAAMAVKQKASEEPVKALNEALSALEAYYKPNEKE